MNNFDIKKLIENNTEIETIEYKTGLKDAETIGQYISGLANAAIEANVPYAYLIWGVEDKTRKIVGTDFDPNIAVATTRKSKKGNNGGLKFYLEKYLNPKVFLRWNKETINGKKVVCLIIDVQHLNQPVKFKKIDYIRIGTSLDALNLYPEDERRIWETFESSKFELEDAKNGLSYNDLKKYLDIDYYRSNINEILNNEKSIIESMIRNNIIKQTSTNLFSITNLGAYTLAKDLHDFPILQNRSVLVTRYSGIYKLNSIYNQSENSGIIISFEQTLKNIMSQISYKENYDKGERKDIYKIPSLVVRELLANALVHQDFTLVGSRPMVEIFDDRLTILNPGVPLIEPLRFLDEIPRSRNPELADLLGKFNIVESRGTGIDKVIYALEQANLPAIEITSQGYTSTQVVVREQKKFKDMSPTEKINSIYWDASFNYANGGRTINNAFLRKRFNLSKNGSSAISKAIAACVDDRRIKQYDSSSGKRFAEYIPYWGKSI